MKIFWTLLFLFTLCGLNGCVTNSPSTLGELSQVEGGYGYTPLDPLPVNLGKDPQNFLDMMPDTTMRLAIGSFDASGNLNFGPVKMGVSGSRYQVIMDYIQYTTLSMPVSVKEVVREGKKPLLDVNILPDDQIDKADKIVPVYVGIGLRLTANVTVLKDNVDLSNLVSLGAAASSNQIRGTLTVQAMGISGETVSELLPMPSSLDQSTVQTALTTLSNIKSKLYGKDKVFITPQVVAIYNPFNGSSSKTVSGLVQLVLSDRQRLVLSQQVVRATDNQKTTEEQKPVEEQKTVKVKEQKPTSTEEHKTESSEDHKSVKEKTDEKHKDEEHKTTKEKE